MSSWLERFSSSEPGFEADIVERYSVRLMALARRQLPQRVRRRVDPEDVVQSVYRSFFRRLNEGRFAFEESHDVWRLLAAMTFHKARNAVKFHQRERRDVRRDVPLARDVAPQQDAAIAIAPVATDSDVSTMFEMLERLLDKLPENYRRIVVLRLDGSSIEQIAERVKRSRRTVLRVLAHLQELAAGELERSA